MHALHEQSGEFLSPRVKRLKRAAAEARDDADAALSRAVHAIPASVGILPALLSRVARASLHTAGSVVRRHPVSAVLIAAVLLGTVLYHRSVRHGP